VLAGNGDDRVRICLFAVRIASAVIRWDVHWGEGGSVITWHVRSISRLVFYFILFWFDLIWLREPFQDIKALGRFERCRLFNEVIEIVLLWFLGSAALIVLCFQNLQTTKLNASQSASCSLFHTRMSISPHIWDNSEQIQIYPYICYIAGGIRFAWDSGYWPDPVRS
jgi:hypothetical protein